MKKIFLFTILLVTITTNAQKNSAYKIIYEADKDGNKISGNLEGLANYALNGNPIRVGWELNFNFDGNTYVMTHWTDAGFITVLQGHVFAQINSIYSQGLGRPQENTLPTMYLNNAEPNGWVALIGTTGVARTKSKRDEKMIEYLKKTMTDKEAEEFLKKEEVKKFKTKWAVMISN